MMMDDSHGDVLGRMTPCSKNFGNCFFTSLAFIKDCLYNPMFGIGESGNIWISCSTSPLGGNPWALRTHIFMLVTNPPIFFLCFFAHTYRDALPLIDSSIN